MGCAISTEGKHPKKNPIWLNDWLEAYCNKHKKKKKTMSGGGRDLTSLFARMRRGDAEAVKGAMTAQARRA